MFNIHETITRTFLLQNAICTILDQIATEIDSHAACIITKDNFGSSSDDGVHLSGFPTILGDCDMLDEGTDFRSRNFIKRMQHGVNIGCSFFITTESCALPFLNNFREIHDAVDQKYETKVLVILDTQKVLTYQGMMDILGHRIVKNDLPLTLLFQPDIEHDWIDIWSAFPYNSYFQMYNRFFLGNISWQYNKQVIPNIIDLSGVPVFGAFIHYPPYTAYYHVTPGTGNAQLYESDKILSVQMEGLEATVLVEFYLKYNCRLTARLDYDEELWLGLSYPNETDGLIGALEKRDANVTCAAVYLWDNVYEFTQYSPIVQKPVVTHIVPIPLPLPYWQTPLLPFPGFMWGFVIGVFLLCALTLFFVNATQKKTNVLGNHEGTGLFDSIYVVFMISIFQGVIIRTKLFSDAFIFTMIFLYALVIGNLYLGGLASVLTSIRYEEPISSVEKLIHSDLLWGGTSCDWMFTIEDSEDEILKKFMAKYIVKAAPELLKPVQKRKMAITVETLQYGALSYEPFIDKESSEYYMMMKTPLYWQFSIIMSFMRQLNRIVYMQRESGIGYYWELQAGYKTTDYVIKQNIDKNGKPPGGSEAVKLSIHHILGALFLLAFGSVAATFSFLLELLLESKKKKAVITVRKWKRYVSNKRRKMP